MMISAKAASITDDGYSTLLSFADDPVSPVNCVLLQITNKPDKHDCDLGLDGVHLEAGNLNIHGYDLVQDIRETDAGIVVSLTKAAAHTAEIGEDIEIELGSKIIEGSLLSAAIQRFKDRLLWKAKARLESE